jgi:phage terminase small subunit
VAWRNEMIAHEDDEGEDGEGVVRTTRVLEPRVSLVPSKELDDDTGKAIAEVSQTVNGALRIKMHDKHAALVSIGKHLGMFVDGR